MKKRSFGKKIAVLLIGLVLSASLFACGSKESSQPTGKDDSGPTQNAEPAVSLRAFCADEEVDAWFDSLDENLPVKMELWIYGEAPFDMEFTDPDLILRAARALETVEIDGLSRENPDNVSDYGGFGYAFEAEDGSEIYFSFPMGCFKWKSGEYHDVASYGELRAVNDELERIGNPQLVYIYSEDDGFYTQYLETYSTQWKDEEEAWGGLCIFTENPEEAPFVQISRITDEAVEAESYLRDVLAEKIEEEVGALGCTVAEKGELQEYSVGGENLPGILFTLSKEDGTGLQLLVLTMEKRDSLLGEDHLVRFCTVYDDADEDGREKVMQALNTAVKNFHLKHMYYEQGEVKPGNTLLAFCNDKGLQDWYQAALQDLPDEITYVEDTWYIIDDPETIYQVLLALDTVRIGDISDAHVGGSNRRVYDFYYDSGKEMQSFFFFADTFDWDGKSYDVLDWGELKSINLKKKASASGR